MVSDNIKAGVSTGENLNNVGDFYSLVRNQAADVLNVSSYQSGVIGLRQISNFAYAYEIPVTTMNCIGNYNAHIATSIPNHIMMEVVDPGREKATGKPEPRAKIIIKIRINKNTVSINLNLFL